MSADNPYCEVLGIDVPSLEHVKGHREARPFALLIVALLERGRALTLEEAAERFEEAGVESRERALAGLKRCRPGRPPIYRDGDLYALDPHDHETDLWAFRLGLRGPRAPRLRVVLPERGPLPERDRPLTVSALEEAWRGGIPNHWSAQRIAICVLDAHASPLTAHEVLAFVRSRGQRTRLDEDSAKYWRRGAPVRVRQDGRWEVDRGHAAVGSARAAVVQCIEVARRSAESRFDPSVFEAQRKAAERRRRAHADALANLRRVVVYAFPANAPVALTLVDLSTREIRTYLDTEMDTGKRALLDYDVIAAVEVRGLVRALGIEPGDRRLSEVGPPQKSRRLNKRGRTLKITLALLVQGSCGISRPFGDAKKLEEYAKAGQWTRLRRRLEADAKSIVALHEYGRLHGCVRLRWGFLDERIPAPWVHRDERTLYNLKQDAFARDAPLDVVVGTAPGWDDPWARAEPAFVVRGTDEWHTWLVDADGRLIEEEEVQRARLASSQPR